MIKRFEVNFPLVNGEMEKRTAYIYLPESYEKEPHKYYPVLYMFDGHNVFFDSDATFGKSWGMQEYMDKTNTQMIIAAVECNHSPNHGRLEEYSPFTFRIPDVGFVPGRGKATMDWYVDVFKRGIDKNYRTLPDREHTFIAGSSMGGLMSLYAALNYNHVFSRAACLSASLWVHPYKVLHMIRSAQVSPDTCIYLDYGTEEIANHPQNPKVLFDASQALLYKGVNLTFRIVPGGSHCEASWEKQVPVFMKCLGF
jgi:predicted alpha/beta superfamily hydrolase